MIELANLELNNYCMLNEDTGEVCFYREKQIEGYTGVCFKYQNIFLGMYPSDGGVAIYYEKKKYPLTSDLTISLTKNGKHRTFRIEEYGIEINYTASPFIDTEFWLTEEIDLDLLFIISERYKEQAFYDQYSRTLEPLKIKEPPLITNPLPLGSIILLKGAEKRLMITGFLQKQADSDTIWHYTGVVFPEGMQNSSNLFLFNEDQIEMVFFIGMQDAEDLQFLQSLAHNNNQTSAK